MTDTLPPEVVKRRKTERRIARRAALTLLKAGFTLGVHDGQEVVIKHATTAKAVLDKMFSVDEEHMLVYDKDKKRVGYLFFVYGNDGWDVLNDYSANLEPHMGPIDALIDKCQE